MVEGSLATMGYGGIEMVDVKLGWFAEIIWKKARLTVVVLAMAAALLMTVSCSVSPDMEVPVGEEETTDTEQADEAFATDDTAASVEERNEGENTAAIPESTPPAEEEEPLQQEAPESSADVPQPEETDDTDDTPYAPPSEGDIHAAIMANHETVETDTPLNVPFYTEAHQIWAQEQEGDTCTVYALVWYAAYDWENGQIVGVGGTSAPAAMTFHWEDGWKLTNYWIAEHDENYTAEVQKNLPESIAQIALAPKDSSVAAALNAQCTEAAKQYYAGRADLPGAPVYSAADVEYSGQVLTAEADTMTYEERLAWITGESVEDKAGSYVSCGTYLAGEGCLAYVGQWIGTPHGEQFGLSVRFADGTAAALPLPRSGYMATACPELVSLQNGTLVYEVSFAEQLVVDGLIHLAGTYHYEVDLNAKTVSLTIL